MSAAHSHAANRVPDQRHPGAAIVATAPQCAIIQVAMPQITSSGITRLRMTRPGRNQDRATSCPRLALARKQPTNSASGFKNWSNGCRCWKCRPWQAASGLNCSSTSCCRNSATTRTWSWLLWADLRDTNRDSVIYWNVLTITESDGIVHSVMLRYSVYSPGLLIRLAAVGLPVGV